MAACFFREIFLMRCIRPFQRRRSLGHRFFYRAPLKIRFVKRGDSFFRRQAKSKAHSRGSVTEIWRRIRRNEARMSSSVLQSVLAENDSRKEFLEVPYKYGVLSGCVIASVRGNTFMATGLGRGYSAASIIGFSMWTNVAFKGRVR